MTIQRPAWRLAWRRQQQHYLLQLRLVQRPPMTTPHQLAYRLAYQQHRPFVLAWAQMHLLKHSPIVQCDLLSPRQEALQPLRLRQVAPHHRTDR